jgi:hypothetical protein
MKTFVLNHTTYEANGETLHGEPGKIHDLDTLAEAELLVVAITPSGGSPIDTPMTLQLFNALESQAALDACLTSVQTMRG